MFSASNIIKYPIKFVSLLFEKAGQTWQWGYSPVAEDVFSMHKVLGLIPSTVRKKSGQTSVLVF